MSVSPPDSLVPCKGIHKHTPDRTVPSLIFLRPSFRSQNISSVHRSQGFLFHLPLTGQDLPPAFFVSHIGAKMMLTEQRCELTIVIGWFLGFTLVLCWSIYQLPDGGGQATWVPDAFRRRTCLAVSPPQSSLRDSDTSQIWDSLC